MRVVIKWRKVNMEFWNKNFTIIILAAMSVISGFATVLVGHWNMDYLVEWMKLQTAGFTGALLNSLIPGRGVRANGTNGGTNVVEKK